MKKQAKQNRILIAVIIIVLIIIVTVIAINSNNKGKNDLAKVEEYVGNNYLKNEILNSLENGKTSQDKMNTAIISINRDNGSKLKKYQSTM